MTNSLRPHLLSSADRQGKIKRLRDLLIDQVLASSADGIIFSGGLDTSIVAAIATSHGRRLRGVMISVAEGTGLDEPFARTMADRLRLTLDILRPSLHDLLERMPDLIALLQTFDPMELRNSIVAYLALEAARKRGSSAVLTGDAADELFAGYTFMFNMAPVRLPAYIRHLNGIMHFTSQVIGRHLSIGVDCPYETPAVRDFALSLEYEDLVGESQGQRFGKKILREAFASLLPEQITWRVKTPIEYGSGSTALKQLTEQLVSDSELAGEQERAAAHDSVKLRDKEQCFYYRMFRKQLPPPIERVRDVKACPECHGPVSRVDMSYCRICGAYPI